MKARNNGCFNRPIWTPMNNSRSCLGRHNSSIGGFIAAEPETYFKTGLNWRSGISHYICFPYHIKPNRNVALHIETSHQTAPFVSAYAPVTQGRRALHTVPPALLFLSWSATTITFTPTAKAISLLCLAITGLNSNYLRKMEASLERWSRSRAGY